MPTRNGSCAAIALPPLLAASFRGAVALTNRDGNPDFPVASAAPLLLSSALLQTASGNHRCSANRRGHRSAAPAAKPERPDHQIHIAERIRRPKAIGPCG